MKIRTAVLLTCYNRPTLIVDAIASVLEQEPQDWRLFLLDDGCDEQTREAISRSIDGWTTQLIIPGSDPLPPTTDTRVVWWQGPPRTAWERRARIPYSILINIALNSLVGDEPYHAALCDDDYLMPGSLAARADYLDQHADVEVVFGRLRAVQFDRGGMNQWAGMAPPIAGRHWRTPTGERVYNAELGNARHFYADGGTDPDTDLPYVEEGFWLPGPTRYAEPHRIDHNQCMWRASTLRDSRWPAHPNGGREFWCEDRRALVGDAAFFSLLGQGRDFVGVDAWVATKRYHSYSDGVSDAVVRE